MWDKETIKKINDSEYNDSGVFRKLETPPSPLPGQALQGSAVFSN